MLARSRSGSGVPDGSFDQQLAQLRAQVRQAGSGPAFRALQEEHHLLHPTQLRIHDAQHIRRQHSAHRRGSQRAAGEPCYYVQRLAELQDL